MSQWIWVTTHGQKSRHVSEDMKLSEGGQILMAVSRVTCMVVDREHAM